MNFSWNSISKPIVGLSPMDGVTDAAMRSVTARVGKPDIIFTEFTSAEGLMHNALRLLRDFYYTQEQHPIIAQIFGATPECFRQCAVLICELGFDGMDINMGCPSSAVTHHGGGAALIQTPKLAQELIRQSRLGITDWVNGKGIEDLGLHSEFVALVKQRMKTKGLKARNPIPLSVKTRIGYSEIVTEPWISTVLEAGVDAISLHGRTLRQQYSGEANWEEIAKAASLAHHSNTILLGNGDIKTVFDIKKRIEQSGVDGVLIGRAAMGNPWFFNQAREYAHKGISPLPISLEERIKIALEHVRIFEELNRDVFIDDPFPFLNMRKHLGWYFKDIDHAVLIRQKLFQTASLADVENVFREVIAENLVHAQ